MTGQEFSVQGKENRRGMTSVMKVCRLGVAGSGNECTFMREYSVTARSNHDSQYSRAAARGNEFPQAWQSKLGKADGSAGAGGTDRVRSAGKIAGPAREQLHKVRRTAKMVRAQ